MNRCTSLPLRFLLFAFACAALVVCACTLGTIAFAQTAGSVLPKGTVPSLRGVVSGSAVISTPVPTATGNILTITQLNPQVIIDWNTFNIASGSTVQFIQPSSSSSALNRIYSADPTIIQGNLIANGQIFLINQNGILFDRGSQINVNTLYASTLNISNTQFAQGVVGATATTPSFVGGYDNTGTTTSTTPTGSILIGTSGPANAPAPKITAATGGAIVLLAPMINNQSGIISSPDGQVILAAGNVAYLQFPDASDTTLRGLVVEIDASSGPVSISSMITNMGTISAARGNVTLAGLAVNQGGVISATTALQKNGSVYLQANTVDNAQVGTVTLLPGSVIETPLDTTDKSTLPESQSYDANRAQVMITGGTIIDEGAIKSPAGDVSLAAIAAAGADAPNFTPRIYLGQTSVIDVSGDIANAPLSDQLLTFKVTSNELANSPDQKSGILKGATVTVDLDAGSSLLDLSAYQGAESQTLAEKATSAGTVTLTSSGDVIQRIGSQVLANAGQINYAGGKEPVTLLVGSDGKVYSITNAPEDLTYTAILGSFTVDHPHWGENDVYNNLVAGLATGVSGFTNWSDAGSISILPTTAVVLDGTLSADTTIGVDQLSDAPRGGSLTIGTYNPNPGVAQNFGVTNVVFGHGSADTLGSGFTPASALTAAQINTLRLSSSLFGSSSENANGTYQVNGFQTVTIGANQSIVVPKNVTLSGALTGSMTLQAQTVDVEGNINLPAGSIALTSLQTVQPLAANAGYAVQVGGTLSTAGLWSNSIGNGFGGVALPSSVSSASGTGAAVSTSNGGSIALSLPSGSVSQASSIVVASSATLDVSAGGSVASNGKVTGGAGGSISIASANSSSGANRSVVLDGSLQGYGFNNGGSLSLVVANANITNASPAASSGDPTTLTLAPSFFDQGGFASYSVTTTGNLDVAPGTQVAPQQQNLVLNQATASTLASGSNVAEAAVVTTLPAYSRAPTSIALNANQGAVTISKGAVIETDPKATISVTGGSQGGIDLAGKLDAPAGTVNLTINNGTSETSLLHVESSASIDVAGTYVQAAPSLLPIPQGTVLGGGTVSIKTLNGDLVMDSGSVIDVSGAAHTIGLSEPSSVDPLVSNTYTSDAGHISIVANDQLVLNSTLLGHASGNSAGGSFALTYTNRNDLVDSSTLRRIVVTDDPTADPASQIYTDAVIALAPLRAGGFDRLALSGEDDIQFNGPLVTAGFRRGVTLDSQQISVANGTTVNVRGAAVALTNSYGQRYENDSQTGTVLDDTYPSLPIATTAGTGVLNVHASTLDLIGSLTINGASQIDLVSSGDTRLTGRVVGIPSSETGASLIGGLTTLGDLTMQASQIYPTTRSLFTISVADDKGTLVPGGSVDILGQPGRPDAVLSAGASLTINADNITQAGSVDVPLGSLVLNGASRLDLMPGSTTSVSGNGEIIPYGGTSAGTTWLYASTGNQPLYNGLTAPPSKSMSLTGADVSISKGATVNISGGGDILGIEFVPGSGGSSDALAAANTYAIIPTSDLSTAPIDTAIATVQNLGFSNPSSVYNSIHIGPGGPVPAGNYALLPGYYALLPGAYIVQVQTGSSYANLQSGQTVSLANGLNVVPAYEEVAGTNIRSSQTIGVIVQPGSNASKLADYNEFNADFFTKVAQSSGLPLPLVPADAGQLTLAATQTLNINGTLDTKPGSPTANTAQIDITGNKIAVVDSTDQSNVDPGFLLISSSELSSINGSVLLGGTRVSTGDSVTVTPDASQIVIANSASSPLEVPELLLAATGSITLNPGSVIEGAGSQMASARNITIDGSSSASGAFIRAANSGQIDVTRSVAPSSAAGLVDIQGGATIGATGSLLIEATGSTTSDGRFAMGPNSALSLLSSQVNLGEAPSGLSGLTLNQSQLASLNSLSSLQLQSYGAIDVYGPDVVLGGSLLKSLTLDSNSIIDNPSQTGQAGSMVATAQSITLQNSAASSYGGSGTIGSGTLTLNAPTVVIGAGSKSIAGFSALDINAQQVVGRGVGELLVAAPIEIDAARVTGDAGANQTWIAADLAATGTPANYYGVTLAPAASTATLPAATGLGAKLSIEGSDINLLPGTAAGNVSIVANAGNVSLAALGGGTGAGVTIGAGALIDASGKGETFVGSQAIADAGSITLSSDHGAVTLGNGSSLNVSAAAVGGNAGSVSLAGPSVLVDGALLGKAGAGETHGSFTLDSGTLSDFSTLNNALVAGGFTQSVDLRIRSGSVVLTPDDAVNAHDLTISTDNGSITLAGGSITSTSGQGAGLIALNGASGVTLGAGSIINVSAPAAGSIYDNGGTVAISSSNGAVVMAPSAVINASGALNGNQGLVSFTAPRTAGNSVNVDLEGTILGKSNGNVAPVEVDIYGNKVYNVGSVLQASDVAGIEADNQSFMANVDATALGALLKGDGGGAFGAVHVRPGVVIQTPGNLTLDQADSGNLNLTDTTDWLLANSSSSTLESGTLTIRAGGTLTLSNVSVGLPDDQLYGGYTWNINLVGGADLSAANVMQTLPATSLAATGGNVVLDGPSARVTSGTGAINIAAGNDFLIDNPTGVVYTSGAPVAGVTDSYQRWANDGGNISIYAGHDATGSSAEFLTDWFRRTASGITGDLGAWWTLRSDFEDGVGALGGGDVVIFAGNDINNLSASVPTSGRVYSPNPLVITQGRTRKLGPGPFYLDVEGGGDLNVTAGNDIIGGQYFVGLGTGTVRAGGSIGAGGQGTQLFLMGEDQTSARQAATFNIAAGGSVNIQGINDPTELAQTDGVGNDPSVTANNYKAINFNSYSPNSAINVQALGGDISIYGNPAAEAPLNPLDAKTTPLFSDNSSSVDWPAAVSLVAYNGAVSSRINQTYSSYPSSAGNISVFAATGVSDLNLTQSDLAAPSASPSSVSDWLYPINVLNTSSVVPTNLLTNYSAGPFVDDIVVLNGSISDSTFVFPAASRLWAGQNIDNVQSTLQNDRPSDVSEIIANQGFVHPSYLGTTIAGPGELLIQAGGTIDLGTGPGAGLPALVATGNSLNPSLSDATSARITLVAGVTGQLNLGDLSNAFSTLITAGENKDTTLAQTAANGLFGTAQINPGDINTYQTAVETDQGSGIDLIAPHGDITVGLTTPPTNTATIGIVTNDGGAIRSYLSGNFNINQGKVLTAQGGDIEIYTTDGSIDAGRGAKTSISVPAPERVPVYDGSVLTGYQYIVSSSAAGSGIQTLTSASNAETGVAPPPAGNIYLFAPAGTVDAGEAGIVSEGKVVISALQVLNASNISATQGTSGVPTVTTGSLATSLAASGTGNTSSTDRAAADAARAAADAAANSGDVFSAAVLSVEVLGFGAKQCRETDKQCLESK